MKVLSRLRKIDPRLRALLAGAMDEGFYRHLAERQGLRPPQDVVAHYLAEGHELGLDPAPDFSGELYRRHHPDIAETGADPFLHFLRHGRDEGRRRSLSRWAGAGDDDIPVEALHDILEAVDADHYRAAAPELRLLGHRALAAHYLAVGWRLGLDPSDEFSTRRYLAQNSDVAAAGINPLLHYIRQGRNEGRTAPPAGPEQPDDEDLDLVAPLFDAAFYRRSYGKQVAAARGAQSDRDLLGHYMTTGWRDGLDPTREFSTREYLELNRDVRAAGVNPLLHYARTGWSENRRISRRDAADIDLDVVAPFFDAAFYRAGRWGDEIDDQTLLNHYMTIGWRQGRDPSPGFSTAHYMETYPDIVRAGLNPFLHFVLFGRHEGRRPHPDAVQTLALRPDAVVVPPHMMAALVRPPAADEAGQPEPPAVSDPAALTVHWVIPDFAPGGGGHMTIFRMIRHLETMGHRCHIWIESPTFHATGDAAWDDIVRHFQCVETQVSLVSDGFAQATGDAVVATGWSTAYLVEAARGFAAKYYFVQDHEPAFYAAGAENLLAERTYGFDLACICASPWLDRLMRDRYGRWSRPFHLAYDAEVYRPAATAATAAGAGTPAAPDPAGGDLVRIAAYARHHTERRCVPLMLMALQILGTRRSDFEVHFFGIDKLSFNAANFRAINRGVLEPARLAALYRGCDIGITLSATNYSLVPQEMMACGLPVLELDGESTRAIFPAGVVELAGPDPHALADALERMIDDPAARDRQRRAAFDWVSRFSWQAAATQVERAIVDYLAERGRLAPAAPAVRRPKEILLDVVIPTWNGRGELEPVVEALRRQDIADQMQVHCIDSSSTDGTADWLRAQPDIALTTIPQAEFQHGRTRNQGAAQGAAPVIAFLTQDARPVGGAWASDILRMMRHHPEAAGLFGRHLPYPHHPAVVRQEIEQHFASLLKLPLALSRDTDPLRWDSGDPGWRQVLHFYSDNNSAMRRRVWQEIPYPEVDYGEDQLWARQIIEAGLVKLHAPTACVYHSHDYGPDETYRRAFTEAAFFREHFGYSLVPDTESERARDLEADRDRLLALAARGLIGPDELDMRLANAAAKQKGLADGMLSVRTPRTEG